MPAHAMQVEGFQAFTALDLCGLLARKMFKRGDVLRFLRETDPSPLTQRELAARAGVSLGTVQRAEQGSAHVTTEMWMRLANVVGMTTLEMDQKAADMSAVFNATHASATGATGAAEGPAAASNPSGPGRGPTVTEDVYLQLLRRWWSDLDEADHERIVEFARATRIERLALKKVSGHPNE